MLSIALSLYFSTIPQYCLDQSLLFILLQFCIKYWSTVQMYIIELLLAYFSDLGNVCNKTSVSLTNCYRSLNCAATQYIADIFLCCPLKKDYDTWRYIFAVDYTIYQTLQTYVRKWIFNQWKRFVLTCWHNVVANVWICYLSPTLRTIIHVYYPKYHIIWGTVF